MEAAIRRDRPRPGSRGAGTEDVNRVVYGLAYSVEAHWYFHLQGLDGDHHRCR